jgi:hypothetical protein
VSRTGRMGSAACLLWLAVCTPCAAQLYDYPEPEGLGPTIVETQRGRASHLGPDGRVFPDTRPGLGVTSTPVTREDGSRATRNGIIGSMPVAPNMELGVGVFAVTRYKGEPDFKRTQPMRDVGERQNRLAAVGLKVKF